MDKKTKLTLSELIRRKEQMLAAKKTKQTQDLYIPSLKSVITIEEPNAALCRDAAEMDGDEGDRYICYECVKEPNLKAQEVQETFGCAEPMDIADIVFKPGEISQISRAAAKLAGYNNGVKEIKN